MDLSSVARSMRARMPWSVGQLVLVENDVARGRGWDRTVMRLSADDSPFAPKTEELAKSLKEHLLCGEKLTRFFHLNDDQIDTLWDSLKAAQIEPDIFSERYPLLLDEEELAQQPLTMRLTAVEEIDGGLAAVYSSVRLLTLRKELDREEMTDAEAEILSRFEEIYVVEHRRVHSTDVLWIPPEGNYVDVRVDYPYGMLRQTGEVAQNHVRQSVRELIGQDLLADPANLFPLMKSMYEDADEGLVSELAFGTTTASLKHEKMRRDKSCLRQEIYHRAGKAALSTPIEPYKLSIVYNLDAGHDRSSTPELNLHSSVRSAGGRAPKLTDAVIRKCAGFEDFDHVRARVEHFLALGVPAS